MLLLGGHHELLLLLLVGILCLSWVLREATWCLEQLRLLVLHLLVLICACNFWGNFLLLARMNLSWDLNLERGLRFILLEVRRVCNVWLLLIVD